MSFEHFSFAGLINWSHLRTYWSWFEHVVLFAFLEVHHWELSRGMWMTWIVYQRVINCTTIQAQHLHWGQRIFSIIYYWKSNCSSTHAKIFAWKNLVNIWILIAEQLFKATVGMLFSSQGATFITKLRAKRKYLWLIESRRDALISTLSHGI